MELVSFSYKTIGWCIKKMDALKLTNLLVGRNAAGKTRIIRAIQNVTSFICVKQNFYKSETFSSELCFVEKDDKTKNLVYRFEIKDGHVLYESLVVNGQTIISRDENNALLYGNTINPPEEKLVVQVRRDRYSYPEIETLMEWADGVTLISCSDINPLTIHLQPTSFINPVLFSDLVSSMNKDELDFVIGEAKELGYQILEISSIEPNSELKLVSIKEKGLKEEILDLHLSNGMIRVLYLLCYLVYVRKTKKCSMLLIDDLGEGLDYSRTVRLGKKLFEFCENEEVQLIASSNDTMLMDVIDVSKWQILQREQGFLYSINQDNNPKLFNDFRLTGLSNSDLFSSDYIDVFMKNIKR